MIDADKVDELLLARSNDDRAVANNAGDCSQVAALLTVSEFVKVTAVM